MVTLLELRGTLILPRSCSAAFSLPVLIPLALYSPNKAALYPEFRTIVPAGLGAVGAVGAVGATEGGNVLGVVSAVSANDAPLVLIAGGTVDVVAKGTSFKYRAGNCGSHCRARAMSPNTSVIRSKGRGPGERDWSKRK